jgi:LysR family transcriptional regulator, regulator for metE and metH
MIETRHLQMICAIAESGSMTNAAIKLFLTQPSLSHQLKDIESRLGTQLFLRVNKKLVLTPAGERLLREANEILPRLKRIESDLQNGGGSPKMLRISTQCYTCYHWLPRLMSAFQRDYADIQFDVVTEAMSDTSEFLLSDKIDLAVTSIKPDKAGIHCEKLFDDEQVLIVPQGHRLAKKEFVTSGDFEGEHMVIYKESRGTDYFIAKVLEPAGVNLSRITRMQLTEARVELVKAGLGITVLSKWLVRPFLAGKGSVRQIRIGKKGFYRSWYLATLAQKKNEPHIKTFGSFLKDHHENHE